MESLIKILAVILPIIVPVLIAFINSRYSLKKHPKEEFEENVRIAERFVSIDISNTSHLVKDRLAQQLIETKNITYLEVMFFYQFHDAEKWIRDYLRVKDKLKLVRDRKGKILTIQYAYSRKKRLGLMLGYLVFASIGLTPFLFIDQFISFIGSNIESKQYLIVFNLFIWPFFSIILALLCLCEGVDYKKAQKFVEKFRKEAIKL